MSPARVSEEQAMKIRNKQLTMAIRFGLAAAVAVVAAGNPQDVNAAEVECDPAGCTDAGETLVRLRTEGERHPRTAGESAAALQDNRRVDIALPPATGSEGSKVARAVGRFAINLPQGGVLWATEDPAIVTPTLNASAGASAPVGVDGKLAMPLSFSVYSNYARFIDRYELSIYRGTDGDLVTPIATLVPPKGQVSKVDWNGETQDGLPLRAGDDLIYVVRAYDAQGHFDEAEVRRVSLLRPDEYERSMSQLRAGAQQTEWATLTAAQIQQKRVEDALFGTSSLRRRNIPLYGSRIRVFGQDIPEGFQITIDGEAYPIDLERKFVAELMLPIGSHTLDIDVRQGQESVSRVPM